MRFSELAATAASIASVSAFSQGFNYGTTKSDGTFLFQADYEALFKTAQGLTGTTGFTSARLYDTIQGGSSTNEPTQAIPAALSTKTTLLLGLWATSDDPTDDGAFDAQITALLSAVNNQQWAGWMDLVVGISVGSEDLYRNSPVGKDANAGVGVNSTTVARRINKLKGKISGTGLSKVPIGHVDTWTAWVGQRESVPQEVIDACDFIGLDAYPYFESTLTNPIEKGSDLFDDALKQTETVIGNKPIWITETGWPVSGKTENLGVPGTQNAKTYWDAVGCPRFGNVNIWWYTLQDAAPVTPNPSFGVVGSTLSTTPLYDLSCKNISSSTSSSASASATSSSGSSKTASGSSSTGTGSSGSGSGSGVYGSSNATAVGTGGLVPTASSTAIGGGNNVSTTAGSGGPAKTSSTAVATAAGSSSASMMSVSFVGAVGAMFVAIMAL